MGGGNRGGICGCVCRVGCMKWEYRIYGGNRGGICGCICGCVCGVGCMKWECRIYGGELGGVYVVVYVGVYVRCVVCEWVV